MTDTQPSARSLRVRICLGPIDGPHWLTCLAVCGWLRGIVNVPEWLAVNEGPQAPAAELPQFLDFDSGATAPASGALPGIEANHRELHARRRELLRLKRVGDKAYDEEEFADLRRYIDDFQRFVE